MPCTCKTARYDAAGHRILTREDMIHYYKNDRSSQEIVIRWMPHRYVVIPAVEVYIDPAHSGSVRVCLIYPGETREFVKDMSVRGLEGLRATYKGRRGWTIKSRAAGLVVLRSEGRVIMDPEKRYGIYH